MSTLLYPNPATRRIVEQAIANNKVVLWIYVTARKALFFNPGITSGTMAGATATPSDQGAAMALVSSSREAVTASPLLRGERDYIKETAYRARPRVALRLKPSLPT